MPRTTIDIEAPILKERKEIQRRERRMWHLAAVLRQHGVRRLYTSDVDFQRFDFLDVRDPFT